MTTGYQQGRNVEWDVVHHLTENGYECLRAASSKGVADVVAFKPGQALFVNVKRTRPPGPEERADLLRVAGYIGAVPLVALRPPRCRLRFRVLTGPGPNDWRTWVADELTRCQVCGGPADDAVCAGCGGAA
jgi:Holliday junction resolvase